MAVKRSIDSLSRPGGVRIQKIVKRLIDIMAWTEIGLGHGREFYLVGDSPIDVRIGNTNREFLNVTELRLKGNFDRLYIRGAINHAPGRCVIFVGDPELGDNWQRPDPYNRSFFGYRSVGVNWDDASATRNILDVNVSADGREAVYVGWIEAVRTAGTIEGVYYADTEGYFGNPYQLWYRVMNPGSSFYVWFERPLRLSINGSLVLVGSITAGTTLSFSYGTLYY